MSSLAEVLNNRGNPNVNNVTSTSLNNVNNVKTSKKAYSYNIEDVQRVAHKLAGKLNDQNSFEFFCKVAWNLPENVIWNNLEQAMGGKNPRAYFTFLCNLSLKKSN